MNLPESWKVVEALWPEMAPEDQQAFFEFFSRLISSLSMLPTREALQYMPPAMEELERRIEGVKRLYAKELAETEASR